MGGVTNALVLIDPPYEDKRDYHKVETALAAALQRFPAGLYAVWYPCLQRADLREPERRFASAPPTQQAGAELEQVARGASLLVYVRPDRVDDYLAGVDGPAQARLAELIALVRATAPEASCTSRVAMLTVEAWVRTSPRIEAISWVASWVCRASLLTSSATTLKPRPASPARAASMAALRASRLVW